MTAPDITPMPAALEDGLAALERAIRAGDYKDLARQTQATLARDLEVYQAALSALPYGDKLPRQTAACLTAVSRPLTRTNAGIAAIAIDALLVTHAFHFPSRAAARRSQS